MTVLSLDLCIHEILTWWSTCVLDTSVEEAENVLTVSQKQVSVVYKIKAIFLHLYHVIVIFLCFYFWKIMALNQ